MAKTTARPKKSRSAGALVDSAWRWLGKQYEREPDRRERWQAVGEALEAVEARRESIGDLTGDTLTGALDAWLGGKEQALLQYLDGANPREVIDLVEQSARALEAEARRREEERQALLDLAKTLGSVGVKLLLGALLAV